MTDNVITVYRRLRSCQAGAYCVRVTQGVPPTVGDVIAARVRSYRLQRGWSVRQLAEECARRGAPQLTAASLGNIERGREEGAKRKRRDVTVEELVILAYVLNVAPVLLILPLGTDDAVALAPGIAVHPYKALEWIDGRTALPGIDEEAFRASVQTVQIYYEIDYYEYQALEERESAPGGRRYREALERYANALRLAEVAGVRPPPVPPVLRNDLDQVVFELRHRGAEERKQRAGVVVEIEPDDDEEATQR